tara:strand:+ start:59 stop:571 length:513 start_codon:yes stop_codon:yes gene_type:complete
MKFLEKDLEEIIFETSNKELNERGLFVYGKKYRQLRIGNYGVADLVFVERTPNYAPQGYSDQHLLINVVELKKDGVGISAFLQALGYVKGIQSYINKRGKFDRFNVEYKITLIGSKMKLDSSYTYLSDILPSLHDCDYDCDFLSNYTFSYNFDGITFSHKSGYKLINEGF